MARDETAATEQEQMILTRFGPKPVGDMIGWAIVFGVVFGLAGGLLASWLFGWFV